MTAAPPVIEEYLSLRPGVYRAADEHGLVLFRRDLTGEPEWFGPPDAMKRAVLDRLARGPCRPAELTAGHPGEAAPAFVAALRRGGWLICAVHGDGRELYALQPVRALADPPAAGPGEVLSRFAVLRREGAEFVVESPLAAARLLVRDTRIWALIGDLRPGPEDRAAVAETQGAPAVADLPDEVAVLRDRLRLDLRRAGLVVPAAAETGPVPRLWRPHDLWFHARSRLGSGGYVGSGFGRTGWAEPAAARREPFPGRTIDLYRPDLDALRRTDVPFTTVVEDRRSTRTHDDAHPITVEQLGELLYRCAAVRRSATPDGGEYLRRPHPSGGAAYELELYPVIRNARGVDPGLYHYDPYEHRLRLVRAPGRAVTRLLRTARHSAGMPGPPQVLVVVAARFGRLMATYEELPYALVLKHVGVLYQSMYLVATAMGLAVCALGAGNARAFNDATGLDYLAESSVGELVLGGGSRE